MKIRWAIAGAIMAPVAVLSAAKPCAARDVTLSEAQIKRLEIKVLPIQSTAEQPVALLPGTVIPALNARIVAPAPFAGTVTQVHVLPGQRVEKGAALATVSSRELIEAASALAQAEADLQLAEANARRRRSLADMKIQNPTMAEEAESQVAKVRSVIEQHKRTLALAGASRSADGKYTIEAPASGRVVEASVMPGAKVDAMSPAVTLDTSDDMWIEAQLPPQFVKSISPGDRIRVVDGPEGKVIAAGGSLDKLTRSANLIVSVEPGSGLIPGQMVTMTILQQAAAGSYSVPASAVVRINDVEGVFVRNPNGFTLVPVDVAGRSSDSATISGDLPGGAQVASSGIPQLEQMLGAQ